MDVCLLIEMTVFQVFTKYSFITAGGSAVHDFGGSGEMWKDGS